MLFKINKKKYILIFHTTINDSFCNIVTTFIFSVFSKVMVATGWSPTATDSVEIIDLLTTSYQCQNFPNFPQKTRGAIGELDMNGNPIMCGGDPPTNNCETFFSGSWVSGPPLFEARFYSSIIKLPLVNDPMTLFLTGSYYPLLNSAEVLINGKWEMWPGTLPGKIGSHCMVMLNSTTVILIGGKQDDVAYSNKTHFLDIQTHNWFNGPELKFGRRVHSCARIPSTSQSSEQSIVVVGGYNGHDMSSVEILDEGSYEWRQGPELPLPISCSVIVEHPLGGIALIGGRTNDVVPLNTIYRLANAGEDTAWELMPQQLQVARHFHTAFLVPDEVAEYCEN